MYHSATDTPAAARTSNLNEELGMVKKFVINNTFSFIYHGLIIQPGVL